MKRFWILFGIGLFSALLLSLQMMRSLGVQSRMEIAAILPDIENETARNWLMDYGEEQWNTAKLKESLQRATEWGRSHQVHVTCNEFGVYRQAAPPEGRGAWLRDVRSLLEQYQIGWAMWEYDSGFGVIRRTDGEPLPDPVVVKALFD
jgi:hypothetical protein